MDDREGLRQLELADLKMHWDDAYDITWDGRMFVAKRRDNGKTLSAIKAPDLREDIRTNYSLCPVKTELD